MTNSSQFYQQQLQDMGAMPNFQQEIAKAYENPVLKPITQESARLESQYLPSLFEPFNQMGTNASDMSPAAKLSLLGGSMGRLTSQMNSNRNMGNFFGAQVNDLASTMNNSWQQRQQQIKDMFSMAFQQEEAKRQQEASRRAAAAASGGGIDMSRFFNQQQQMPQTRLMTPQQQQQAQQMSGSLNGFQKGVQAIAPNIFPALNALGSIAGFRFGQNNN